MMRPRDIQIVWSLPARKRLREIRNYVAVDKPEAAERLAIRIVSVVEALRAHPMLGRVGSDLGIRELVVGGTPYIILYTFRRRQVVIRTIWHDAREKP